jgi:hypothetical protein
MRYFGTESSSFDISVPSIPKVVGSNPTVARHIFQACPVWIYTQSNRTSILFTWVHYTNTANFKFFVCLHGDKTYNSLFVETPRKFITAKLSIRKPGSSSVLII